jgi:ADP-ribose pyrophosphatase YjhB (NUDIX family)
MVQSPVELLKEICIDPEVKVGAFVVRRCARTVLANAKGEIAVLWAARVKIHKIVGGGIEDGEDVQVALAREILEEAGAKAETMGEIGVIIEWKNALGVQQISYCFHSKVVGEIGAPEFDEGEIADGYSLEWHPLDRAIKLMENDKPTNYNGKYMLERDLTFLREYAKRTK